VEGTWSNWGGFGTCSQTCYKDQDNRPFQTRTRTCTGWTLQEVCTPGANNLRYTDSADCNTNVGCPGAFNRYNVSECSETCQSGSFAPTFLITDICVAEGPIGYCISQGQFSNGQVRVTTDDCNDEKVCEPRFGNWEEWSACSDTCNAAPVSTQPTRTRTRRCFGGSTFRTTFCTGINGQIANLANEVQNGFCNQNVGCPGILGEWAFVGDCPATCQLNERVPLRRMRKRACDGGTLNENCNGVVLQDFVVCNLNVSCPGVLSEWGPFTDCSRTCYSQANDHELPTRSRVRTCVDYSFNAQCGHALLQDVQPCNQFVICPIKGEWGNWGVWTSCSKTCGQGFIERFRNCSDPFPANAGNNCDNKKTERESEICNLQPCPVDYPVRKDCLCLNIPDLNIAPELSGEMKTNIETAIATMNYWTDEVQMQICEDCRLLHLNISITTVNNQIVVVDGLLNQLKSMKAGHRNMISCNQNFDITAGLWSYYDYVWERCSMLEGVLTELKACKLRFDAAYQACESYDWFHSLMTKMFRKRDDVKTTMTNN